MKKLIVAIVLATCIGILALPATAGGRKGNTTGGTSTIKLESYSDLRLGGYAGFETNAVGLAGWEYPMVEVGCYQSGTLGYMELNKPGAEFNYAREQEVYVGMCRRWHETPKPTIAMVQGACIAGGLMLAWVCDLIVAAEDAFFADPVVRMGIPGVEYFAHPWVLGPRAAKEFLFTGDRFGAARALELGMVNRVVPRADQAAETRGIAGRIAQMPRFGLALTKRAVNQAEDQMGLRAGMDSVFGLHHFAHAHNAETSADSLGGLNARSMRDASGS